MLMTPSTWASTLNNAVSSKQATTINALISVTESDIDASPLYQYLRAEATVSTNVVVNVFRGRLQAPWADVAIGYIKVVEALRNTNPASGPDFVTAAEAQHDSLTGLLRWAVDSRAPTGWCVKVMYALAKGLKALSASADDQLRAREQKPTSLEKASRLLQKCFSACLNDRTGDAANSRKVGTYGMATLLFKTYFELNSIALCKNVIKGIEAVERASPELALDNFPLSHQVTYLYYLGVFAFLREDYKGAEALFVQALSKCHRSAHRNIQMIYEYLVPIRMTRGVFPSQKFFRDQPKLALVYRDFIKACRTGNVALYDRHLRIAQKLLMQRQTYPVVEKAREVAVRRLLKNAWILDGKPAHMAIESFRRTFVAGSAQALDGEEAECLVANMIAKGFIKGYISHEHQKVVLSKLLPFPWYPPVSPLNPTQQARREAAEKAAREKMPNFPPPASAAVGGGKAEIEGSQPSASQVCEVLMLK